MVAETKWFKSHRWQFPLSTVRPQDPDKIVAVTCEMSGVRFLALVATVSADIGRVSLLPTVAKSADDIPWLLDISFTAVFDTAFLSFETPFDKFASCRPFHVYDMTDGSSPVPYVGPIAKRVPPTVADYIELMDGASMRTTVNLSNCFQFEAGHTYSVQLAMKTETFKPGSPALKAKEEVHSQPLAFVASKTSRPPKDQDVSRKVANSLSGVNFISCSTNDISTTRTAITNALNGLTTAYDQNLLMGTNLLAISYLCCSDIPAMFRLCQHGLYQAFWGIFARSLLPSG
jgi:hypothetical protein